MVELRHFPDHITLMGDLIFASRFEPTRALKQGGGIETYLGTDRVTSRPVIIKTVAKKNLSGAAEARLAHEAEVLRNLKSRYLVPNLCFGRESGTLFLVNPYVHGETLEERLKKGPLSWRTAFQIARDLLCGIAEVHSRGIIHRDIKPANIILSESDDGLRAMLIDFGLAGETELGAALWNQPAGTVYYVSPEQAGLLNQELGPHSDLYSLGIVLYEMLTGKPPFRGNDIGELLCQHLTAVPPDVSVGADGVPRPVADLVSLLLKKEPRDRYQTAEAVLHDIREITSRDSEQELAVPYFVGLHDKRSSLTNPTFVGRNGELALLESSVEKARKGNGDIFALEGISGSGKSKLLTELIRHRVVFGERVLFGQGVDQQAQRPYQMLEDVMESLHSMLLREPELCARVRNAVMDHGPALASAFPVLNDIFPDSDIVKLGPEDFGETRTLRALSELFVAMGTREKPLVVIMDDCQWVDDLSLKLFKHWREHTLKEREEVFVGWILSFRAEEVDASHLLRTIAQAPILTLQPLGKDSIHTLATSMSGPLPLEVLEIVEQLSGGSPFLASAVMWGLYEGGAIRFHQSQWQWNKSAAREIQSSRQSALLLVRRFKALPEKMVRILQVGAVLGKSFDVALAAQLQCQEVGEVIELLREGQRRQILWCQNGNVYSFVHDKLRETLLEMLTQSDRLELHRLAAKAIEEQDPSRTFDLAYHYDAAGEFKKALPHALVSAEQATGRHSLEIAERQYRIAERGLLEADLKTRGRVLKGMGTVLMLRGKYEEAEVQLCRAATFTLNDLERVELDALIGELHFKRGDVDKASESLEAGLRRLGYPGPTPYGGLYLQLVKEGFVQALHTLFPKLFVGKRSREGSEREFIAIRTLSRLAYVYWFKRGALYCGWAHLREMNLVEKYPPSVELAQAYSEHAPVSTFVAWFSRGIRYVQESLAIRKSVGDVWGQGQSLSFYGAVLYGASRYSECIEKCQEAVGILERTGDQWEVNTARWHIAYSLYRCGRLREAVELSRTIFREATQIGDKTAAGISLSVWAKASGGKVPAEYMQRLLGEVGNDLHTLLELKVAEAIRLLGLGSADDACNLLAEAADITLKNRLSQEYMAAIFPWHLTALRILYEKKGLYNGSQRERSFNNLRKAARVALRTSRRFKNNLPHTLRELGRLAAIAGHPTKSRKYLDESVELAREQKAEYELARSWLARGQVGLELMWQDAQRDLENAREWFARESASASFEQDLTPDERVHLGSVSLADRFEKVLSAGKKLATCLTRASLFTAIQEATSTLLRTEDFVLLEVNDPGDMDRPAQLSIIQYRNNKHYSKQLVRRALESKAPVSFTEGANESPTESQLLGGIRSSLCCPIFLKERPTLILYVSHREVRSLFKEEEERIVQFITSIAGAALENIEGLKSLQGYAEQLKQSNTELEQFAYVASHDLQEPLRMVASFCQLLRQQYAGRIGGEGEEWLTFAVDGAQRMQTLIRDLLLYSRVQAAPHRFELVDFNQVIAEATRNLTEVIQRESAQVHRSPLPQLYGDHVQLVQLFQNLIGNAIKFRGADTPRIDITAEKKGAEWILCIADNGIGIEPEYRDKIFEIFRRLHSRENYPGTGIGLAVCKRVVNRHGGRIWVESNPGKGSRFYVLFKSSESPLVFMKPGHA